MSEQSQGHGWWQASDGKWYPPQAPSGPDPTVPIPMAAPTAPATKGGVGRAPLLGVIAAVIVVLAGVLFFVTKDDKKAKAAIADSEQSTDDGTDSPAKTTTTNKHEPPTTTTVLDSDPLDITVGRGFVPFRSDADGFAIAVPERMRVFDLSSANLDQIKAALGSDNPELAAVFDQAGSLIAKGGKLYAVDPSAAARGEPADTLNIIRTPGGIDPTTKAFSNTIVQQLEGIGATDVNVAPLNVPAGKAVAVAFTLTLKLPDGSSAAIHGKEGVVQAAGALWVITYAASPSADAGEFKDVVDSFVAV